MGTHEGIIDLEPRFDRATGEVVFVDPRADVLPADSTEVATVKPTQPAPQTGVVLPDEEFAGSPPAAAGFDNTDRDWGQADASASPGQHVVLNPDGTLQVTDSRSLTPSTVSLPRNAEFAATATGSVRNLAKENQEVTDLQRQRVRWLQALKHASLFPNWTGMPVGWYFVTAPNRLGDQLVAVAAYHNETQMYHAYYWRFEMSSGSGRVDVPLPEYLGRHPQLTNHTAHLYNYGGQSVLCLSKNTLGGLPTLTDTLVRSLQWTDGISEVVRGRRFPFA